MSRALYWTPPFLTVPNPGCVVIHLSRHDGRRDSSTAGKLDGDRRQLDLPDVLPHPRPLPICLTENVTGSKLDIAPLSLIDRVFVDRSTVCRRRRKKLFIGAAMNAEDQRSSHAHSVAISYSCPILQQLMTKLMSRRAADQRIHGLARKILKMESWIWTSIADSRGFWTQTTDMFAATFQSRRLQKRLRHFAKTALEISKLGASTSMHQ
jgi:hypothetical protein